MKLLIVESPSKAKTIEKYLSSAGDFRVRSSVGHIRDLPKSNKNAINLEKNYKPNYEISAGKKKVIADLVNMASKSEEVYLATDPDREGEAIAWHIAEILKEALGSKLPDMKRVAFHEITEDAVLEAIKNPRSIDTNLRKAQEARRVLDRLVGYDLSGLIWKKVRYGLSAGRVQSPALRILMEREREIRAFIPEAYYTISGLFKKDDLSFTLVCDIEPTDKKEAEDIVKKAKTNGWHVTKIKETEQKRTPKPPFTTSTLQQTASTRLGMSPSRTMQVAQKLYEKGYITYMRTDSTTLSKAALAGAAKAIENEYGKELVNITQYKSKSKNAQEAHEAIRPSKLGKVSAGHNDLEKRLYGLIRARTLASQMIPATVLRTKLSANIADESIPNFSTTGSRILSPGWLLADPAARGEENEIPPLSEGDKIELVELNNEEKHTKPPNRYTEAGLVKELEKRGIGRPSTYASIMKTLIDRGYVTKEGRTLFPTDTGDVVSSFLEDNFGEYISDTFTADFEDRLDSVASGDEKYEDVVGALYEPLHSEIESKEDIPKITNLGKADPKHKCPGCKSSMVIKLGRTGKFLSCEKYPECDGARTIDGNIIGESEPIGNDNETGLPIFVLNGRFGPYVQLGEKTDENPKPKRASIPKDIPPTEITLEQAQHLLVLPRTLGQHPDDNIDIIANIGRFGPYVGHGREFRSLKKPDDPYTVTFERSLEILKEPKKLPKGVERVCVIGKHPKTGKNIEILKSKSGIFLKKGLKRIYLPDSTAPDKLTVEEALEIIKSG
jgi:DNA topoisomerase-1